MSQTVNTVQTGTFTGTGQSTTIMGRVIDVAMDFAGTATVDIERRMPSGSWVKVGSSVTADSSQVLDYPAKVSIRLNCTAHTNNVEWVMQTGAEG